MRSVVNGTSIEVPSGAMPTLPEGNAGAFETLLLMDGLPVFWEDHWKRFDFGCRWHGFAPPVSEPRLAGFTRELAERNGVTTGVVRFAAWRTAPAATGLMPGWRNDLVWRLDVGPVRPHMGKRTFRIDWGPELPPVTADRALKHLNRGPWNRALAEARARGCDEVLLRDGLGRIVEGGISNVFFVCDGALHTPDLGSGPLPGIMRARVLALARQLDWRIFQRAFTAAEVEDATEIWLTNSLIGIRPAGRLAARCFDGERPMLDLLRAAWEREHGWDPAVISGA